MKELSVNVIQWCMIFIASGAVCAMEALTLQNDNLILPLFCDLMFLLVGITSLRVQ